MTVNIDWENLGFSYMKLHYRFIAHFKNGQWSEGQLTEDAELHISESSPALHYGQQAFEGLKAYRTKEGNSSSFVQTKMPSACNGQLTACSWSLYRRTFSSRLVKRWSKPTQTTFLPMELVVHFISVRS